MLRKAIAAGIVAAGLAAVAGASAAVQSIAHPNVVREIGDPSTGDRWLLEPNPAEPGGPGRLVRVAAGENVPQQAATDQGRSKKDSPRVIRAGDRVVVEEHTAVMDAELEGVALIGACAGARLRVRLKIGGKVVSAVALGPGRVELGTETGGWR